MYLKLKYSSLKFISGETRGLLDALKDTRYLSSLGAVQGDKEASSIVFIRGGVHKGQLRNLRRGGLKICTLTLFFINHLFYLGETNDLDKPI